jgi:hypothetical protein
MSSMKKKTALSAKQIAGVTAAGVLGTPLLGLGTYAGMKAYNKAKAKQGLSYKLSSARKAALKKAQAASAARRRKK